MQLSLPFLTAVETTVGRAEPPPDPPVAARPRPLSPPSFGPATTFVRNARARRYILRVRPDGTLRVTIPCRGSRREAEAFVARQRRWIERERDRVRDVHGPREWSHGSMIPLDGVPVPIAVVTDAARLVRTVDYAGRRVRVGEGQSVRAAVEADLVALARERLEPRVRELAAAHGLTPRRVTIRSQRTRWGSCTASGDIALNFRLVQVPADVRDYVLLHELMHLRQQNHSRRFWRLVAAACPAFRDAERWLRTEGRSLF